MSWNQPDGYYVDISIGKEIKFPNRCVVCNQEYYGNKVLVHGNPVGYYGLWVWQSRMGKKIEVPSHYDCGSKLKGSILSRNLILSALAVIVLALTIYFDWSRWTMLGILFLLLFLPISWQLKNATPFEFEFEDNVYEFHFADKKYAEEFAILNDTKININKNV